MDKNIKRFIDLKLSSMMYQIRNLDIDIGKKEEKIINDNLNVLYDDIMKTIKNQYDIIYLKSILLDLFFTHFLKIKKQLCIR